MSEEILNRLMGGQQRPIPARPAHLRVGVAELRARLASQSQEERDQLVESVQDVYDRVVSAPHDLQIYGGSRQEAVVGCSPSSVTRPALRIVHEPADAGEQATYVKVVVAGSGGTGKTTLVRSIATEVMPLSEEADSPGFGKIVMAPDLLFYLFTMPDPAWRADECDALITGAIATIVLVDARRPEEALPYIEYLRRRDVPYVVCLNTFDGIIRHRIKDIRSTLALAPDVPVKRCDARVLESVRDLLIVTVTRALEVSTLSRRRMPAGLQMVVDRLLA